MNIISPTDWGAQKNYDLWSDPLVIKDDIGIHWGGTVAPTWKDGPAAEQAILRSYESYHLGKGWRGIAYGYAVGASGNVYRLRGKNLYGAHQGDHDGDGISNNQETIPILFIMGEKSGQPTAQMWLAARQLYQYLLQQPWTDGDLPVYGHREIQPKPTSCPGDDIMAGIKAGWIQMPIPNSVEKRVEEVEDAVVETATFLDTLSARVDTLGARVAAIGTRVDILKARADASDTRVDTLEGRTDELVGVVAELVEFMEKVKDL